MEVSSLPLVTAGVPVYNGQAGLARCLDCLLAQDYPNLEIVISDNGSTDGTPAIAEAYASRHPNVKYHRAASNRGSSWNFNRVFELSSGTYFFWAAHDDERAPGFVSACVRALEANPVAALCQVQTEVSIAGHAGPVYLARLDTFAEKSSPVSRYRETLKHFPATAIYGVYRSSIMRRTGLLQPVIATDLAFVQEVSIHGTFIQVPETLFRYCARKNWNTIHDDARVFLGIARKPWWYWPGFVLLINHATRVVRAPIGTVLKARLLAVLAVNEVQQLALKVLIKITGKVCPHSWRERAARAFCRWRRNPNLDVIDDELYVQRVCKPQLGWWR